jgi:hypothetical protein
MFCPHCGTELPDGSQFCGKCGSRLNAAAPTQANTYGAYAAPAPAPKSKKPIAIIAAAAAAVVLVAALGISAFAGVGPFSGSGGLIGKSNDGIAGTYKLGGEGGRELIGTSVRVTIDEEGVAVLDTGDGSITGTMEEVEEIGGSTLYELTNLIDGEGEEITDLSASVLLGNGIPEGDYTGDWRISFDFGDGEVETYGIEIDEDGTAVFGFGNCGIDDWDPSETVDLTWEETDDFEYTFYIDDADVVDASEAEDYPFEFSYSPASE